MTVFALTNNHLHPQRRRSLEVLRLAAMSLLLLGLSISAGAAQGQSGSRTHVFLMRGFANVFSLGMDQVGARLQRMGINASVENYIAWDAIVNEAAAEYRSGQVQNIIIVGHSSGATAVTAVAARLGEMGVPVKLAIALDPTTRAFAAGHVERYLNFYAPGGMGTLVDKGRDFTGNLQNISLGGNPGVGHFNIDKDPGVQDRVIKEIMAAARGPAPRPFAQPSTVQAHATPARVRVGTVETATH
jgi:pimeloyl-ACP methyl ester carboxylesterase